MIDNLSIVVHAFTEHMLTSLSIEEILLPRYVNLSTNLRELPFRVEIAPSHLKHMYYFICIHVEANCLLLLSLGNAEEIWLG